MPNPTNPTTLLENACLDYAARTGAPYRDVYAAAVGRLLTRKGKIVIVTAVRR
jgi:hypothetical protein